MSEVVQLNAAAPVAAKPRALELRNRRLRIEFWSSQLEVNLFKPARHDAIGVSRDTRVMFAHYRLAECYLHARRQDGHFRLWLDRTAIGISSKEFDLIRAAFPEIEVREVH